MSRPWLPRTSAAGDLLWEQDMSGLYLNFGFFALIASITPGPSNLVSLMIGSRRGTRAALPFILGASLSMALILLLAGLGLAELIERQPLLKLGMGLLGALWMTLLAWKLATADEEPPTAGAAPPAAGWLQGAGLQVVNPKAWMMALSTISLFSLPGDSALHVFRLALIFFFIAIPCQMLWSWLGQSSTRVGCFRRWRPWIYRSLAGLLLLSVWSAVLFG